MQRSYLKSSPTPGCVWNFQEDLGSSGHFYLIALSFHCCSRWMQLENRVNHHIYRPRSKGDNTFGSVCLSVRLSVRPSICGRSVIKERSRSKSCTQRSGAFNSWKFGTSETGYFHTLPGFPIHCLLMSCFLIRV